MTKQMENG